MFSFSIVTWKQLAKEREREREIEQKRGGKGRVGTRLAGTPSPATAIASAASLASGAEGEEGRDGRNGGND